MTLSEFWFSLIAVVWIVFFVLEGFDLGVGMLHGIIGRDETGRRMVINTIGPLWDGNEVWLIVAGAAIFAAFPGWYATMFSGFYLALVILLGALMARGISFEYRGKRDDPRWVRTWDGMLTGGSLVVALLIGVALGDLLHGLPISKSQEYTGSFWNLLQPYGLYTGITLVAICVLHGATFVALKTTGDVAVRAARIAQRAGPVTALVVIGFAVWTHAIAAKGFFPNPVEISTMIVVIAAAWLVHDGRQGWAFASTTVTMALVILSLFTELYPNVMISSTRSAYNLTIRNTASPSYTLKLMTIVALVFLPVVLAYTAWNYYVFRKRLTVGDIQPSVPPRGTGPSPSPSPGPGSGTSSELVTQPGQATQNPRAEAEAD